MDDSTVFCSSLQTDPVSASELGAIKCQVCFLPGHGIHFGAYTCRACAAFFRIVSISKSKCHFSPRPTHKCRNNSNCKPKIDGRWFCKTCRLTRCLSIGMSPENIQYDRDKFESILKSSKNNRHLQIPNTVESQLCISPLVSFSNRREKSSKCIDISQIVKKAVAKLLNPAMIRNIDSTSNLEQLTSGFKNLQSGQKENIPKIDHITLAHQTQHFNSSMCSAAVWLGYSDRFKTYSDMQKIKVLQAIWCIWGRLEGIVMTAKMRIIGKCEKEQFFLTSDTLIVYDNFSSDLDYCSTYPFEEMKYFFIPREMFHEDVISELVKVQPDDVETTYLMSVVCLQLTGKRYGGLIQEEMEQFQDILSNDLHEYYINNKMPKYLLRIKQLMRVKEMFLRNLNIRMEKYKIAGVFNVFNRPISNLEFFTVPI
ncbi:Nuclear receptor domain-containing protein [Caenorhabditis elegans]|uniref:Nuclear receptor domain-containing protein n=2 Tax=Caenorhabditis elegans TaxID=6239 RepID=H2KZT0_CAEEL|nr:Nuclear receptor domain-containing protein [Caenorhabditis elegans]CCD69585.1 Nuclear receptor domain-containing protein [Caenorhabditis elegans]|eukprot:NP_001041195.1 Nuclear Hormone Receptor family [Caenorhabditis elegans]